MRREGGVPEVVREMIVRAFVDWQVKRRHAVFLPSEGKVYRVRDEEVEEFLRNRSVQEIYLESAPRRRLYGLLDARFRVFILRRKCQRSERKKRNCKKNDEADAKLLYSIFESDPEAFQEYHRRALDALAPRDPTINDDELARYKKVSEKLSQLRQQLHEWPELQPVVRELSREEERLKHRLNRKYAALLGRFSDVEGFGGPTLLLFLAEIPDLRSFGRLRDFLIYLGLRAVYSNHRNYHKRARHYLWLLACQVRKRNDERRKGETIWQTMRWLAAEAYRRLR